MKVTLMISNVRRDYYIITVLPALVVMLLVGCLTTTNHNPMKKPKRTSEAVTQKVEKPIAAPLSAPAPTSKCVLYELLLEAREALERFREARRVAEPDAVLEFERTLEAERTKAERRAF
jgi:hypothetical protein